MRGQWLPRRRLDDFDRDCRQWRCRQIGKQRAQYQSALESVPSGLFEYAIEFGRLREWQHAKDRRQSGCCVERNAVFDLFLERERRRVERIHATEPFRGTRSITEQPAVIDERVGGARCVERHLFEAAREAAVGLACAARHASTLCPTAKTTNA